MPIAIEKNKYINSSGSLIGVLNLTIDNAPIKPRDRAKDDLTIKIIKKVIWERIGITMPMWNFPDNEVDLFS